MVRNVSADLKVTRSEVELGCAANAAWNMCLERYMLGHYHL